MLQNQQLKQRFYSALGEYGFRHKKSSIPGYLDCMEKGGIEISVTDVRLGLRVDIDIPNSTETDQFYFLANCGGKNFVSAIQAPMVTNDTLQAGLENVLQIVSHRLNPNPEK